MAIDETPQAPRGIADYALIGDGETAALVGRDASIDWLCWPAFDSEACFAALLGGPANGRWSLAPSGAVRRAVSRYRPETLVLDTCLETAEGAIGVTDFMPFRGERSHLVRIVSGRAGQVRVRSEVVLRFGYGRLRPWLSAAGQDVSAIAGPDAVRIHGEAPIRIEDGACVSDFVVKAGDAVAFSLSYYPSHEPAPDPPDPRATLVGTERRWRTWVADCAYRGPWREAVVRSLITLKALAYRPTGGLIAAPTSSIPERPSGERNWDYRYCWLRDATFTLMALLQAGFLDEAADWRDWLLRAVAGDPDDLQPIYTIVGRHRLPEWEAPWLTGWGGARPVRFGNAAASQHQLDAFGEVVDALYQAERQGVEMSQTEHALQAALIAHVEKIWREPDRGIWEVRGRPQRFTHSQVMAWAAVDRGVKAAEQFGRDWPVARWRRLRSEMRAEILAGCVDPERGVFTQAFGSKVLDASVLLIPHVGFLPADDPRMLATVEAVRRDLDCGGFIRRYRPERTDDGVAGDEGVFLACSFWLADTLVMQRRQDEAAELFERLLSVRNDVGLLSEEYDVGARRLTGNFPQALSHLALVNTAMSLGGWGPSQERGRDGRTGRDAGEERMADDAL
jgi:GH15 family glucan-1,4-alpha-glucosidase